MSRGWHDLACPKRFTKTCASRDYYSNPWERRESLDLEHGVGEEMRTIATEINGNTQSIKFAKNI